MWGNYIEYKWALQIELVTTTLGSRGGSYLWNLSSKIILIYILFFFIFYTQLITEFSLWEFEESCKWSWPEFSVFDVNGEEA